MGTRSKVFGVRISTEESMLLDQLARHEQRSPSDVVRRLVRQAAAEIGIKPKETFQATKITA